ncbi:MAG: ATP-dependent DNA helicase RecG, partial [Pirellulaceae bacterium]
MRKSAAERLTTPVQYVKGVGPQRADLLARLNLHTACDVLFYFPRDYQDLSALQPIERLRDGEPASVCGVVDDVELRSTGPGRSMVGVLLRQGSQFLRALWFNQPYIAERYRAGQRLLVAGKPHLRGFRWEMVHPTVTQLADEEEPPGGQILPVYPLTEGVNQWQLRRLVRTVVDQFAGELEDVLPQEFLTQHQLVTIQEALREIHAPNDRTSLDRGRRRLIFQELLIMQLALGWRRWKLVHQRRAPALPTDARIDARIRRLFPFELTGSQRQAIEEVAADMGHVYPMNRMLQGEVGSGKTVVAQYAMLLCVAHGHQAVLMAPTEVLARQHLRTLTRALEQSRVRIALYTGSLSSAARRETLAAIAAGDIDLVVGTQAVLGEDVRFARLGLVIIDEQHKFGVRQRAALRQSSLDPHYLVMTATPIPRTVSMTLFGDLDLSTLRELPPGRQPVHTYLADESQRSRWWDFFRRKLREG